MRSTLHVLSAEDFPIYVRALLQSLLRHLRRVVEKYGSVTEKEVDGVTEAVVNALRSGPMTRRELTERVFSLNFLAKRTKKFFELGW